MVRTQTWKIAAGGIFHETNSFVSELTTLTHFASERVEGSEPFFARYRGTRTSMGGLIEAAERFGCELVPGFYAQATPGGLIEANAAETLLDALTQSLDPSADAVVLVLHGAMASENCTDLDGAAILRVREKFGPTVPIAVTIDLHANVSPRMVEHTDFLVGYDTYPHVDVYERALEAAELLVRKLRGDIRRPVRRMSSPGMLVAPQAMQTDIFPMKRLMERAFEIESEPGILNVTVAGGFPYCDVEDAGMSFVVTSDGDEQAAAAYADQLSSFAWQLREQFRVSLQPPDEAVRIAMSHPAGPVILSEGSDNVGGGSPGDGTHLLPYLLNAPRPSLIVLRDPEAVEQARSAGVGGRLEAFVGGKTDRLHGAPVRISGRVLRLTDGSFTHVGFYMTGQRAEMGNTAVVEAGPVTLILTTNRVPPWDPGHVLSLGLEPASFHAIVVKSAIAWKTSFGGIAARAIDVDTPGCCTAELRSLSYSKAKDIVYR
jgi:microcystin degradation protein MlrC